MASLDLIESELKAFIEKHKGRSGELDARLRVVEQAIAAHNGPGPGGSSCGEKSIGDIVCESEGFQLLKRGQRQTGKIMVGSLHGKTIIGTGTPSPLVAPQFSPGIITPTGMRTLTVRDLLSQFRTMSNMLQVTVENAFSNSAAPQAGEGVAKAQSDITFQLEMRPCKPWRIGSLPRLRCSTMQRHCLIT